MKKAAEMDAASLAKIKSNIDFLQGLQAKGRALDPADLKLLGELQKAYTTHTKSTADLAEAGKVKQRQAVDQDNKNFSGLSWPAATGDMADRVMKDMSYLSPKSYGYASLAGGIQGRLRDAWNRVSNIKNLVETNEKKFKKQFKEPSMAAKALNSVGNVVSQGAKNFGKGLLAGSQDHLPDAPPPPPRTGGYVMDPVTGKEVYKTDAPAGAYPPEATGRQQQKAPEPVVEAKPPVETKPETPKPKFETRISSLDWLLAPFGKNPTLIAPDGSKLSPGRGKTVAQEIVAKSNANNPYGKAFSLQNKGKTITGLLGAPLLMGLGRNTRVGDWWNKLVNKEYGTPAQVGAFNQMKDQAKKSH